MKTNNLYDTLKSRGLIYQTTNEEQVKSLLNGKPICAYVGIDPTANCLHIGHCMPLIVAKYLQDAGHKIIVVLGGATAMIGDPTGKSDMRKMVTNSFIEDNRNSIEKIISKFISLNGENPAIIVNNNEWFKDYNFIEFMRDIGVNFNVNQMLSCDAYKNRMANGGLTFFEMGYMLMQAYDFVYLNKEYNCVLEFGGSDQWANILAGADLNRKLALKEGKNAEIFQAFTNPLLLNADGKKMGKTEKGALWVDSNKCSAYDFYQYFYNCYDADVEKLFKMLTYLSLDDIKIIMNGDIRDAKSKLAFEITKLVHGEKEAQNAQNLAKNMFSNENFDDMPAFEIKDYQNIVDILVDSKLASSKSEARRLIEQGGVLLNGEKVIDIALKLDVNDFEHGYAIIKKGKKNFIKIIKNN